MMLTNFKGFWDLRGLPGLGASCPQQDCGSCPCSPVDAAHQPWSLLFQTQQLGARREHLGPKAAASLPEEVRTLTALGGGGGIDWCDW